MFILIIRIRENQKIFTESNKREVIAALLTRTAKMVLAGKNEAVIRDHEGNIVASFHWL